jgi:hypothetical protein
MTAIMVAKSEEFPEPEPEPRYSEGDCALSALAELAQRHGVTGITIWFSEDDVAPAVREKIYTVEAGTQHVSDRNLMYALLRSVDRMPTQRCVCHFHVGPRDLPINQFSRRADRPSGFHYYCNHCNRESVRRNGERARQRERRRQRDRVRKDARIRRPYTGPPPA